MKKLFAYILLATLLISCSSDNENSNNKNSLNGTKWEYTNIEEESNLTYTLLFISNIECTLTLKGYVGMDVYDIKKYTYEIINNKQLILHPDKESFTKYDAVINGNNMTLINSSTQKEFVILPKID